MDVQTWLWIGVLGMALGAAAILFTGKQRTKSEQAHTIISGVVPIIAAVSYFAMAKGQGDVLIPLTGSQNPNDGSGKDIYFARYIDWLFTTPLLLTGLSLTAMHGVRKRWGVILGLIGSDVLMILTALFFGLTADFTTRWIWFAISCGAFLAVYYGIWVQLKTINQSATADVQKAFKSGAVFLSVIWFLYPIVLAIGTDGTGMLSIATTAAAIAILDLVAKVVYGLSSTAALTRITTTDISENRMEADVKA